MGDNKRYQGALVKNSELGLLIGGGIGGILIKASGTTVTCQTRKALLSKAYLFPKNLEN
jgi:hypothetical protein